MIYIFMDLHHHRLSLLPSLRTTLKTFSLQDISGSETQRPLSLVCLVMVVIHALKILHPEETVFGDDATVSQV